MKYKKTLLFILSVLLYINSYSQNIIEGKIFDSETGEPLPFVNLVYNDKGHGVTTGLDGDFSIKPNKNIKILKVSYLGYETKLVLIDTTLTNQKLKIGLNKKSYSISEVVIKPGVNPAHRIINLVYKNRDKNNPEKLSSFRYTSYNKLYFTIDKLIAKRIKHADADSLKRIDSINSKLDKLKQQQHLMIFETVSKREFLSPANNREEIIASKVSGLKDPFIAFLATQFQSFSFYPELITLADKAYLNPISGGSTRKYLFVLEDTLLTSENDTLFIISYRPHKKKNFEGLMGLLTISSRGYAIQSVIAEPSDPSSGIFSVKIQQRYECFNNTWFPVELNTDLVITPPNAEVKDKKSGNTYTAKMIGVGKSYLKDIEINPTIQVQKFNHIEATFDPKSGERSNGYWNQYRKDSLSAQEQKTYRVIDSLGKKENLDKRVQLLESMFTGHIPIGYLSLNINQIIGYNQFEGYRLGIGLETNSKVSTFFKVGGYFANGFNDNAYKYGGFSEFMLNRENEVSLKYSYKNDVRESGEYSFEQESSLFAGGDFYRSISIEKMDGVEELRVGLVFRFLKSFKFNLSAALQEYDLLSGFNYAKSLSDTLTGFDQTEVSATLRFAPGEKFMKTPNGIVPLNTEFPVVYISYTKGLTLLNGDFEYDKVELRFDKSFRWKTFGKTSISFDAGRVFGKVPLSLMYSGRANYMGFSLETNHCFGAMRMNEFISDRFVNLYLKHDFGKLIWRNKNGRWQPELLVAQNIGFGNILRNTMQILPIGYSIKSPSKGYYETGLIVNKIIPYSFIAYGFGVYYRYGAYRFTNTSDNFAYKLTLSYAF